LFSTTAQAGSWHYVQNGISKHFKSIKVKTGESVEKRTFYAGDRKITQITTTPIYEDYEFNEENIGAGLEYNELRNKALINYYGGYYLDSERNDAYYFGSGAAYRFKPVDSLNLDVGGLAIMLSRKRVNDGLPFPAVLPYASLGTKKFALNMSFIPEIQGISVPVLFFQMKFRISD